MGGLFSNNNDKEKPLKIYTFGDSVLDCGRYNEFDIHPGKLLIENNDDIFPEFKGKTLTNMLNTSTELYHLAIDGSESCVMYRQAKEFSKFHTKEDNAMAIITIGGNDLLDGMARDSEKIKQFEEYLTNFLEEIAIRPVFIGTIYDPTLNDDKLNFIGGDPKILRENHKKANDVITKLGKKYGDVVDIHDHYIKKGSYDWFCNIIEPSLVGASEIRRCYLEAIVNYYEKNK